MGSGGAEHCLLSGSSSQGIPAHIPTPQSTSSTSAFSPAHCLLGLTAWAQVILCAEGSFLLQDLEKESDTPLQQVSIEEILEEQRVEQQAKQESEKLKVQALKERGLSVPRADTLDEY